MASFQAKICWKRMRKTENKNYHYVSSYPKRNRIFQKNNKKIRQTKKYHYDFISSENRQEKDEKDRKEKLSLRFFPVRRVIENSKKIAKKFEKLNNTIMASFQAKIGWKRKRKRENKNYHYVSFLPDA